MNNKVYITSITCNDGKQIDVAENDIVVFTGANNCGKSQMLRDIKQLLEKKDHPNKIVVSNLEYAKIGTTGDLKSLFAFEANGQTMRYNNISIFHSHIQQYWQQSNGIRELTNLFVNHLTTEKRLTDSNNVQSYDVTTAAPSNPTQIMYSDEAKASKVSELFYQAFNKHLTLNLRGGSMIPIHIGEKIEWTKENDRISNEYVNKLKQQPTLEKQGDGMRSFGSILINLLTAEQTITLIDEPEAFLHPPQARLLGKMLVKNKLNDRQLFISTHSEDFLKGLLDSESDNIKIIRIDRIGDINNIHELAHDQIKDLWKDPILRYSNILSGLFHKKVIVCESDTDCRFYQAVMDAMHDNTDSISPDILFTHCGGKDRIKIVVRALKALNVNVAAIADIDILNDKSTFQNIVESFGVEWSTIEGKWNTIDSYVRDRSTKLDANKVKSEIDKVFSTISSNELSNRNIEDIKKIIKKSTAWSIVKDAGQTFFSGDSVTAFNDIGTICKGLFIVPVGEIERFHRATSGHGNSWLNQVLGLDLKGSPDFDEARKFVEKIIHI